MGHQISALLVRGEVDAEAVRRFDMQPVALVQSITMIPIDHYFTAYWQATTGTESVLDVPPRTSVIFPHEGVLAVMARALTGLAAPTYAVIATDYFGGHGSQCACVFEGDSRTSDDRASINDALRALGVVRARGLDEFDTVGLAHHRSNPDYLDRYADLCDELGV